MKTNDEENIKTYQVVVNHEEQYSVWQYDKELPSGWKSIGKSGSKLKCLAHIDEVWTDMRPLSLRKAMKGKNPI